MWPVEVHLLCSFFLLMKSFPGWRTYGTNTTAVLGWLCAKSRYKTNPHRAEWVPELSATHERRGSTTTAAPNRVNSHGDRIRRPESGVKPDKCALCKGT